MSGRTGGTSGGQNITNHLKSTLLQLSLRVQGRGLRPRRRSPGAAGGETRENPSRRAEDVGTWGQPGARDLCRQGHAGPWGRPGSLAPLRGGAPSRRPRELERATARPTRCPGKPRPTSNPGTCVVGEKCAPQPPRTRMGVVSARTRQEQVRFAHRLRRLLTEPLRPVQGHGKVAITQESRTRR